MEIIGCREISNNERYLILDNRKAIIFHKEKKKCLVMNESGDDYQNLKAYKLLVLQYFDILKQQLRIVQYVLYNGITFGELRKYVEHKGLVSVH